MKVQFKLREFDLFELFVHDNEVSGWIDEEGLADAINALLETSVYRVDTDDRLGRWVLFHHFETSLEWDEIYYNTDQVKEAWPADSIQIFNMLNDRVITL